MNSIELVLIDGCFEEIKVYANQHLVTQDQNCKSIRAEFDYPLPVQLDVEFWPFMIKPIVRYNDFMLDYWLSDILLQDHKLTLCLSKSFFQDYRNKNIQGRIASLSEKQRSSDHFFDQYIGVNNAYSEITTQIKHLLNK
jgi:hypothetical protein